MISYETAEILGKTMLYGIYLIWVLIIIGLVYIEIKYGRRK